MIFFFRWAVCVVLDTYVNCVLVDSTEVVWRGQSVYLSIWDTAGQEDFDRIRQMSYNDVSMFFVCFSVVDSITCENVRVRWLPEIRQHCPNAMIMLIGTKLDLRESGESDPTARRHAVSFEQGSALANEIGAVRYMECSAISSLGVKAIFDTAVRCLMDEHAGHRANPTLVGSRRGTQSGGRDTRSKCILV